MFFSWFIIIISLPLSCRSSLYILDISSLSDIWFANIFSHSVGCLFILLIAFFAVQRLFNGQVPFVYFSSSAYAFQEIIVNANVKITKGFSMLSSRSLIISDLAFKSFLNFDNFELIFEYGVR